jgi:hypothetical protein
MYFIVSIWTTFVYSLACLGLGMFVWTNVSRLQKEGTKEEHLARLASQFLLGVSLYSAILTLLGLAGALRPLPIALAFSPGIAGLWWGRMALYRAWVGAVATFTSWRNEPVWLWVVAVVTSFLAIGFGFAAWIRPPEGDAEAFYLVYPKVMAATGWLQAMPGPYHLFSTIGLPVELHYTALMVMSDPNSAKLFVWPIALAACALLAAITAACGGGRIAHTLSWSMVLTSTTFSHYIFDGKVDLFACAFGLAAIYWVIAQPAQGRQFSNMALGGLFAGSATVAKFSYVPSLGVTLFVLLVWRQIMHTPNSGAASSRLNVGQLLINGGVMAAMSILAWLPQLLKNGLLFNAPLAPFIGDVQGNNWLNQIWFSPDVTRHILMTYPLALVFGRYPMQGGGLSLMLMAFAPMAFFLKRPTLWRTSLLSGVTLSGLAAVAVWMMLRPSVIAPRYILASLLMLIPIVAIATEAALKRVQDGGMLRLGVLITSLAALFAASWSLLSLPGAVLAKSRGQDDGCLLASTYCRQMTGLGHSLPQGERIFVAGFYAYWLRADQLQCRDSSSETTAIEKQADPASWLTQQGFRYVVVDPLSHPKVAAIMRQAAQNEDQVRLLSGPEPLSIYQLAPASSSALRCIQTAPGRWELTQTQS